MSTVGIKLQADIAGLRELQAELGRIFTPEEKAKLIAAALRKAIKPVVQRLADLTPVGPTSNLKLAKASKVLQYPRDGVAVALVGYRRAASADANSAAGGSVRVGPDRARHQYFVEEGTNERFVTKLADKPYTRKSHTRRYRTGKTVDVKQHQVKGQGAVIASSFNRLGPFRVVKGQATPGYSRVQTDPPYQRAFFKKGKKGETAVRIERSPVGGRAGQPPLQTAWDQTRPVVAETLVQELRLTMSQALASITELAKEL